MKFPKNPPQRGISFNYKFIYLKAAVLVFSLTKNFRFKYQKII